MLILLAALWLTRPPVPAPEVCIDLHAPSALRAATEGEVRAAGWELGTDPSCYAAEVERKGTATRVTVSSRRPGGRATSTMLEPALDARLTAALVLEAIDAHRRQSALARTPPVGSPQATAAPPPPDEAAARTRRGHRMQWAVTLSTGLGYNDALDHRFLSLTGALRLGQRVGGEIWAAGMPAQARRPVEAGTLRLAQASSGLGAYLRLRPHAAWQPDLALGAAAVWLRATGEPREGPSRRHTSAHPGGFVRLGSAWRVHRAWWVRLDALGVFTGSGLTVTVSDRAFARWGRTSLRVLVGVEGRWASWR